MLPSCSEVLWLSDTLGEHRIDDYGGGKSKAKQSSEETGLTWVGCIAGDASALKMSGELPGK